MSKAAKIILIIAGALVVLGMIFSAIAWSRIDWNWHNLQDTLHDMYNRGIVYHEGSGEIDWENSEIDREEQLFNAADISKLDINVSIDDVLIHSGVDSEQIKVVYYNYGEYKHNASVSDDTLRIKAETFQGFSWDFFGDYEFSRVEIWLPESISENMQISISTGSGDIELNDLRLSSLHTDTASGDMDINNCYIADMQMSSASGDYTLQRVDGEHLVSSSTSGDTELIYCNIADIEVKSTSGEHELQDITADNITIKSVSGDIDLAVVSAANIRFEATSGYVEMELCRLDNLQGSTTSGDVTALLVGDSNDYVINASTVSGNIYADRGNNEAAKKIVISTTSGSIDLDFRQ